MHNDSGHWFNLDHCRMKLILFLILFVASLDVYSASVTYDPALYIPNLRARQLPSLQKLLPSSGWTYGPIPGQSDVAKVVLPTNATYNYPGGSVSLPSTTTVNFPKAQLASSAAKVLKILPYVGTGIALYELYQSSFPTVTTQPDDSYTYTSTPSGWGACYAASRTWSGTTSSVCSQINSVVQMCYSVNGTPNPPTIVSGSNKGYCYVSPSTSPSYTLTYTGSTPTNSKKVGDMTETELSDLIKNSTIPASDLARSLITDHIQNKLDSNVTGFPSLDSPSSVSASPVTTPSYSDTPSTYIRPDGQSETTTKTHTDTVTPSTSGNTLSNIDNSYSWTTTTVTSVHNNTTNTTVTTTDTTSPAQDSKQNDLCQLHPDILACQKIAAVSDLPSTDLQTVDLFNFSLPTAPSGTCPTPLDRTLTGGLQVQMSYQPLCDAATALNPIIVGVFIILSIYVVTGATKRS